MVETKALRSPARFIRLLAMTFALVLAGTVVLDGAAQAQSARELKATGLVGERVDGYLGLVQGAASADIQQTVAAINDKRRAVYQADADRTGRALDEVEAVAGAQLRERAGSGDWIQNAAGDWIQKP